MKNNSPISESNYLCETYIKENMTNNKSLLHTKIKKQLRQWAKQYNTKDFILSDPIQFPHRYSQIKDIEISAFLTAWISYGNRKIIIAKGHELDQMFNGSPYNFLIERKFQPFKNNKSSFYRFFKYDDLYQICDRLYKCYIQYESVQDAISNSPGKYPIQKIQSAFAGIKGIPVLSGTSACKRLAMFLRWMIRKDNLVDFGIWDKFSPADLIIPLDTHVHQTALKLGITHRKIADMKTAIEITEYMYSIFPEDPCLADFSLFGYGIATANNMKKQIIHPND